MIDLVKLIRTDRGLSIDETLIREEVKRIIELEAEIANVSVLDTLDYFLAQKAPPCFVLFFCRSVFYKSLLLEYYLCKRFIREPGVPDGSSCCVKQPLRRPDRQVSLFVILPACSSVCFCFPLPTDCWIFQGHPHPHF